MVSEGIRTVVAMTTPTVAGPLIMWTGRKLELVRTGSVQSREKEWDDNLRVGPRVQLLGADLVWFS